MRDVKGKTAIVTGSASGIGLGIAKALAEAGANIVLADLRPEPLEAARETIAAFGVDTLAVTIDVSDPASVEAAGRAALQKFGTLHIAVNNAGVAMHGTTLENVSLQEWEWVIGVNVKGVINGIRTFVPMIRAHGEPGHVVNTGSVSSLFVREGRDQGAYAMTKYAVPGVVPKPWNRNSPAPRSASPSCAPAASPRRSSTRRRHGPIVSGAVISGRSRRR